MEMEIDGVGGVSILAKAKVFRSGVHFPAFSYEKHAETEGFGKVCFVSFSSPVVNKSPQMAKRMKFSVVGLPHYTVWHLYEPSVDDLRHMEEMDLERKQREKEEQERQDKLKKIKDEFNEPSTQWEKDKSELKEIARKEEERQKAESRNGDEAGPVASVPAKESQEAHEQTEDKTSKPASKEESSKVVKDKVIEDPKKNPGKKNL